MSGTALVLSNSLTLEICGQKTNVGTYTEKPTLNHKNGGELARGYDVHVCA